MARDLLDLLWRDHPDARTAGSRGPAAKVTLSRTVDVAIELADVHGLPALTVRRLATRLGIAPNAVYTHVGSRDDLLVLMVDTVRSRRPPPPFAGTTWRARVRELVDAELALHAAHPWVLDVHDQRTAFGPGTITTYDRQLHAFDGTGLDDVARDAALTFVLDFVHASARARRSGPRDGAMASTWSAWAGRLAVYVGDDAALARRVGAAAGAAMDGPSSVEHAWRFGRARVLDALDALVGAGPGTGAAPAGGADPGTDADPTRPARSG